MKKYYLLLIFLLFTIFNLTAQTTEVFETETVDATSFTDNGQVFNITTQVGPGTFNIYNSGSNNWGWNGTSSDSWFIDNTGSPPPGFNVPVQFTIASAGATPFTLKRFYLYLAQSNNTSLGVGGTCTITGKLGGSNVFTATQSTSFNTSLGVQNGFTTIDMTTYGGSNNSNATIDSFVISTTGSFAYVAMDAMTWQVISSPTITTSVTSLSNFTTCSGVPSASQSFTASGTALSGNITVTAPTGYEVSLTAGSGYATSITLTQSGGSVASTTVYVRLASSASSNPSGNVSLTSSGATTKNVAVTSTITAYPAISAHPTNKTVCPTSATTFGVTATSVTSYQWFQDVSGVITAVSNGGTAPLISGATSSTLSLSNIPSTMNGYKYYCTIANSSCATNSTSGTLTVPTALGSSVTAQTNVSTYGGNNGSATITVTGGTPSYSYSWFPSGGTGASASGLSAGTYIVTITDSTPSSSGGGCQKTQTVTITQPAGVGASVSSLSAFTSCTGVASSSQSFTVSGGTLTANLIVTAPTGYEVSLSAGSGYASSISIAPSGGNVANTTIYARLTASATGTPAGNITVASTGVTTKNVAVTGTVSSLSGTTVVTNVACFGGNTGAINLTPTGGTGPYTFNWGSGITTEDRTTLTAGTYSVTITDTSSGCTGTVSGIVVTQPAAAVNGTTVVTNIACFGGNTGAINLTPTGGTGPYTFNWGGSITTEDRTSLTAGSYSVTITDANSCTGTVNVSVTQPAAVVSGTTVVTNVACFGGNTGAVNLTPTGGVGPYTFNWVGGATTEDRTSLTAGNYSVTITDNNGCTGTVNVSVTQPAAVISGTTVVTNVSCFGGNNGAINLTPTGGVGPYTFNWVGGATTEDRVLLTAGTYSVTITDNNGCTGTVSGITITQPAAALSGTTVVTNVACNGGNTGSINLTPTGGTGPYTFNWGGGITTEDRTGLTAGTYSVTITDNNGCTGTVSPTVTQPAAAVSGTTVVTNVACFGGNTGAINLTPTGGVGPYTFNWVGGATTEDRTSLTAGNYSVTITDNNGCTGTVNVSVTQPAAVVSGTTVVTNVACFGGNTGAINLTPTGGVGPYTFNWVGGATTEDRTSLTAGNYSVTITDNNGCTGTVNVSVTQPAAVVSGTTVVTNVSCFGGNNGAINLTPTGGTGPYTFNWVGGATTEDRVLLTAGTYSVTITDNNGCTGTVSGITITQPAAAVSGTTVVTNIACRGASTGSINLTPTGGTGPYTFSWVGGATTEDRTGLTAGSYSVTITDANGCTGTVSPTITQPAAVLGATTVVTNIACFGGNTGAINLTPTGGVGPYSFNWVGGATTEDRTGLTAGNYSVTITDLNGCTETVNVSVTQPAAALSGTTGVTNVSCFGGANGAINLTVTGGTGPYTYNWVGGATTEDRTGLAAGTYSVTITDNNGCTTTVSGIVVGQPAAALSGTTVVTNVSCFGGVNGAINLTPTGGTGPYSFNWGGGITTEDRTGLTAGTYSVTITDQNSCTATVSGITITQPAAAVSGSTILTHVSCNGGANGTINLTPSGGTGPYTFNWGGGVTTEDRTGLAAGSYSVTITDLNGCTGTVTVSITQPTALIASQGTINNVSCNGGANGSATVNVTGGTPAYTYSWTPTGGTAATASGLVAGTYTVTITDSKSCQTTQSFTITQPAASLTATAGAQSNVSCNGGANGSATVNVTGGTPSYTYSWAPTGGTAATASGLTAGTYTVTVTDANSCQTTQSFTITQPASSVNATALAQTNIACRGAATGSATVNVTGGTGAYTYSWAPSGGSAASATNLPAGTYVVTVTDANGCTDTQSFTLTQPAAVLATTAGTINNVSCNGGANGSATVNVTGGTGVYTYQWTPYGGTTATASGLSAGTYTVTVTDANGCQTTRNFTITQPSALVASQGSITNISCNGGVNGAATVNVIGGTGAYSYSWSPSGGTAATASGLVAGTYTVTVTDANNCQATQSFTINQPASLTATSSKTDVLCNGGATGTATVNVSGGTGTYTYLWSPSGGTGATASGLAVGNYSCLITDANGCTITRNFTINQPSVLGATTAQVNATCSTPGQASVTPFGGMGGYTYIWSPGGATTQSVSGLAVGSHSCIITDANGCTITKNFVITTNNTLVASTFQTNLLCNGVNTGSAGVIPSGAPGPYTYVWSPSGGSADTATNLAAGSYSVLITSSNGCSITKNFTITQPSALVATAGTQTNVSCNGGANGSATVNATGGTGGYTYQWVPSGGTAATASGLAAGTYTVTIKDANLCQTTQSFTITQPAALVASAGPQTNVSCNGGTNGAATVAVTGGTGTYTYLWAPSGGTAATASGLGAGTYTVTVKDANLCQTTQSFTITQPAVLAATTSQTNVLCNGSATGTATVTPSGGTAPYTYSWAPSGGTAATASGLAAGTYTCTITDANGCTLPKTVTITQPSALIASAGTVNNTSCNGGANGSATVNVTGGTGAYTYLWAPSGGTGATAMGLAAGTYTVTVKDANLCQTTQSFTVTQPSALTATTSQTNVSCFGANNGSASVVVSGGTGAYTYSWAPSGGTAATATGLSVGTYTVTIQDANSCQITRSFTITSTQALAVTPTQTNVSCNGAANGSATVAVTGGTGTYTYSWAPSGGTAATASGLAPNTYTVTITDGNGCTTTNSFTITQPAVLAATQSQTNVSCNGGTNGAATVTVTGGTAPYTYAWSPSGGTAATATGLTAGNYSVLITDAKGCTLTKTFTITAPTALTATTTQTNILCFGASTGSAAVVATGGTAAYTYAWAPSGGTAATATGLTAGSYTCTITDANGCFIIKNFTITQPAAALAATTTQTNILCFGAATGSATVAATGGTAPYTYSWAPSGGTAATASGLVAGNYTCTITDANGCTLPKAVTITQIPAMVINGSSTNITCNGTANGVASVSVTGGTPGYTYSWSPSGGTGATATGLTAGVYVCTVTDANGCTKTRTFTIYEQPAINVTSVKTDVICPGAATGSATVTVTGGVPNYTYSWSPSGGINATATGLAAGTYICTVTDVLGCSVTHSVTILGPQDWSVGITQTNVSCFGNNDGAIEVNVSGGTAPYTYAWTPAVGIGSSISGLTVGNYSLTITDASGCTTVRNFSLSQPEELIATITKTDVSCYGNNDGTALATITGGTPPYSYSWEAPDGGTPDPSNLVFGTYTVTITDANGCTITGSVTIDQPLQAIVAAHPLDVMTATGGNATYTVNALNVDEYQWQYSEDGTNWSDITDGGSAPSYSGAETNSLTITGIPTGYNGYLYRVILKNGVNCVIISNTALLTIENVILAVNDDFSTTEILAGTGGIAGDVTANDLLNNLPVDDADVVINVIDNDGLFNAAIDADGNLIVPPTATEGTYIITYSICESANPTNCSTAEATVVVTEVVGTEEFRDLSLNIYPNPASTTVFIKIPDFTDHRNMKTYVYDLNGRLVKESRITSELQSIDVTGLESGVYIFKVTSDTAQATRRIIVEKKFK